MCGGHTHWQQVRRLGATFFFNPGSVGLAYNHNQPEDAFRLDPWADTPSSARPTGRSGWSSAASLCQ